MRSLFASGLALLLFAPIAFTQPPVKNADWPQWRGPGRNGICTETGLLREWLKEGPKLLWDSKKVNAKPSVGAGASSLAIVAGKMFTLGDTVTGDMPEVKDKAGKGKKRGQGEQRLPLLSRC